MRPPRRPTFALVGQTATVVGLAGGLISLLVFFRPGCQPQPAPDVSTGQISKAVVERGVTFGYYLDRASAPAGTLSRAQLRQRGVLVVFHYTVQGFKGKGLPLRSQLHDSIGDRIGPPQASVVKPGTNSDSFDAYVWVQPRGLKRRYFVVATLLQPNGRVAVDSFRTSDFRGLPG